ncbi:transketolase [Algiphilus aromaticivorans]|uniref:transketolase n=1 Tax=Algiphilus aromaticivorans TaxID=382454 RepID=UPI0005C2311D|nr:transketolase [Algiphilus aromaticivorans]
MTDHNLLANAVRALSMDAVQAAKSGHPGMPMGMADIATVLWRDFLKHNPRDPHWPDRDRFVLSNGHGSMLLYSLLHLSGYELPLDELRNFRQLHSKTPGHPENGITPGVETTTGPLGQGLTNAVGMALAEKLLALRYNRDTHTPVDHYTYCFIGDGCLMEGISHEACSLAGSFGLEKLIVFYDDNGISIDGECADWFADDTVGRFEAYGWRVIRNVDGHSQSEVQAAIENAREGTGQPTLIQCRTVIGFGAPNRQGTAKAHGEPLGEDEIRAARTELGWTHAPFEIPDEVYSAWDARAAGDKAQRAWQEAFEAYRGEHGEAAAELERRLRGELPGDWQEMVAQLVEQGLAADKPLATRKASNAVLDALGPQMPELLGGSADLTPSNGTQWKGARAITPTQPDGEYLHYGVREFGMSAIMNGLALHGGFIPYGGTFLTFSDYARNALRMAALMHQRSIFVYTHDSIGLGEDGPTHQAVEHASALRLIPQLDVWRPADLLESTVAWQAAIERADGPSALLFTRQNVDALPHAAEQVGDIRRGGYILFEPQKAPEAVVIATGSEVPMALGAAEALAQEGRAVRVVSMPCVERFLAQDADYREHVLPAALRKRLAVEAGVTQYWRGFVGLDGDVLGVDRFGESAPWTDVYALFGLDQDNVAARLRALLG